MVRGDSDEREASAACETALKLLLRLRSVSHQHHQENAKGTPLKESATIHVVPNDWQQCVHLSQQLVSTLLENACIIPLSASFGGPVSHVFPSQVVELPFWVSNLSV